MSERISSGRYLTVCGIALLGSSALTPALAQSTTIEIDPAGQGNTAVTSVVVEGEVEDTPILNIATPNAAGLSHNVFTQYDVGPEGLVINNHGGDAPIASDLAGAVLANPNLSANGEAQTILNEITSTRRSNLFGPQELVGGAADFILANPNGVTCDGCGFLAFPNATVITGKPSLNPDGSLGTIDVDGGDVAIEGDGLDASTTDYFDIVSRSVIINGQINAKNLTITSGRNLYDYGTGIATPKADDPDGKPEFGIDSSALGGMYADRIKLIGTEAGVGVRLRSDAAANAGEMTIRADGKLVFKKNAGASSRPQIRSKGALTATSDNGPVEIDGVDMEAQGDLQLSGTTLMILNESGVRAVTPDGGTAPTLTATVADNVQINDSLLRSDGLLSVTASRIDVDSDSGAPDKGIQGSADVTLTATDTIANAGFIAAGSKLTLEGWNHITNSGGTLQAGAEIEFRDGPGGDGILTNDADSTILAPVINADLAGIYNSGAIIANSSSMKSSLAAGIIENTGDGDRDVSSTNGLIYAYSGIDILASTRFENTSDAYLYAIEGPITLGGLDISQAQGTVRNYDSSIESFNGDVSIYAEVFENTGTPAVVTDGAAVLKYDTGWDDFIVVGGQLIHLVSSCGSFDEGNFDEHINQTCARLATQTTQTIEEAPTDYRSQLLAGGDIGIYVLDSALNKASIISAAQNVTISGPTDAGGNPLATFVNESQEIYTITTLAEFERDSWTGEDHFKTLTTTPTYGVTYRQGSNLGVACYDPGKICFSYVEATAGPVGGVIIGDEYLKSYDDIGQAVHYTANTGIRSAVEAGGTLAVTGGMSIQNLNSGAHEREGSTTLSAGESSLSPPDAASLVSNNPLVVQNPDPNAQFVFQTDPRFSVSGLYGSSDFLAQMGVNIAEYQFLGDSYYEQLYLRQQILSATGQRFVAEGLGSEEEQYKYLLERGESLRDDLNIGIGVALTPDQMANLQEDVVLLVETEVDGQTVLAPKLYLAANRDTTIVGGALLAATDIKLDTAGSVTNEGTLLASNDLSINSGGEVTNQLGQIEAGEEVTITADGDITNLSGEISGGSVTVESREGSVVNKTLTSEARDSSGEAVETQVGDTATITARDDLTISAKDEILSSGGELASGGDTELNAQDVTLEGIEKKSTTITTEQTDGGLGEESSTTRTVVVDTEVEGSGLSVGGNLTVNAGNQLTVRGSDVDVEGDSDINAANVVIESQTETTTVSETTERSDIYEKRDDGSIVLFGTGETTVEGTVTTERGSNVDFGENVTISNGVDENGEVQAADSVRISGSDVSVGNGTITSKDVTIEAATETVDVTMTETDRGSVLGGQTRSGAPSEEDETGEESAGASGSIEVYTSQTTTDELYQETSRASDINVEGSLTINGGDEADGQEDASSVTITGSDVSVGEKLKIDSRDVTIETHQTETEFSTTTTESTGVLGGSVDTNELVVEGGVDVDSSTTTLNATENRSTTISAGEVEINASGTVTDRGTVYDVEGDISINGDGGVSVEAATDTTTVTQEGSETSVRVGAAVDYSTIGGAIDDVQDKVLAEDEKRRIAAIEENDPDAAQEERENTDVDLDPEMDGLSPQNIDDIVPGAEVYVSVEHNETTDTVVNEEAVTSDMTSRSGKITITSGATGDGITIEGAELSADQGIELKSKAGVDVTVAETTDTRTTSETGGSGRASYDVVDQSVSLEGEGHSTELDGDDPNVKITNQDTATLATRSGGVTIDGGQGETSLTGTKVDAGGGIVISGKDVTLNAAENIYETKEQSTSGGGSVTVGKKALSVSGSGAFSSSEESYSEADTTDLFSEGGNITITATGSDGETGKVTSEGTSFDAPSGEIDISGRDITLDTATNTYHRESESVSVEVGIGGTQAGSNEVQDNVDGGLSNSGRSGDVGASVQYSTSNETANEAVQSTYDAQNLTITSTDGGVTIVGGDANVTEETDISANGGSVSFEAATSTYEKQSTDIDVSVGLSLDVGTNKTGQGTKDSGGSSDSDSSNGGNSSQSDGSKTTTQNGAPPRPSTPAPSDGGKTTTPAPTDKSAEKDSSETEKEKKDPGIVDTLLGTVDIEGSIEVEDTTIVEKEGGTFNSGGSFNVKGDGIEIEGTQVNANGGVLDSNGGDTTVSSAESTIDSTQFGLEIGVGVEIQKKSKTTKEKAEDGSTDSDKTTTQNGAPPRPSTPAPSSGGNTTTPAPSGGTTTTQNGAPPRPSTPAPSSGGNTTTPAPSGGTTTTQNGAPPRPSTPAPSNGGNTTTPAPSGGTTTTQNGAPPRPSTPAPSDGGKSPQNTTPNGKDTDQTQTADDSSSDAIENRRVGDSTSVGTGVSISVVNVDNTTHDNASIDFGDEAAAIDANNLTIKGGTIKGSDISLDVKGDLTVTSVADSEKVVAEEYSLELSGSKATLANSDGSGSSPGETTTQDSAPPRPSTPAPSDGGKTTTPAPSGGTATTQNAPPPRPSTPAPSDSGKTTPPAPSGGTTATPNGAPPRPSTPAPSSPPGDDTDKGSTDNDADTPQTKDGSLRTYDLAGVLDTGADIDLNRSEKENTTVGEQSGITSTGNLTVNVGGTTTVNAAKIAAGEDGTLDMTTSELVVGDDLEGSKTQDMFNFRFAATATDVQEIAENWDTTEDTAFQQQGFIKADAQGDSTELDQTVRSTIGEGNVTVTGSGANELDEANRVVETAVTTTGEDRELNLKDTNVLAGDIAQDAIDDLNSRVDSTIEAGQETQTALNQDIELQSDEMSDIADAVGRGQDLASVSRDMVDANRASATSAVLARQVGDSVTQEQSIAVNQSAAVQNAANFSADLKKAQTGGRTPTPAEVQSIFLKAGITVDLVNAADPQAAYDAAIQELVSNAGDDLNSILGESLSTQEVESLIDELSKQ